MADNTQQVVRNYPGNYTVLARGGVSTPSNTYEVERREVGEEVRWYVRAFDSDDVLAFSFDTLRQAKVEIEYWAQRNDGENA